MSFDRCAASSTQEQANAMIRCIVDLHKMARDRDDLLNALPLCRHTIKIDQFICMTDFSLTKVVVICARFR